MEKIKRALVKLGRWQYLALLVLVLVTVFLHLATITHPNEPLFDEQHYVPDARRILAGEGTERVEHPPLAKLIIAGGIEVFGDNPWGWRMPAVILSTIALIMFYDICRRLGTSHRTAFLATLLLSVDNLFFIHSGMAMLDIYVVIFTIAAFWFYLKGPRWWWAAAVSVALAGLSKFSGILAIIPIGLHWFFIGYKQKMGEPVGQTTPPSTPAIGALPASVEITHTDTAFDASNVPEATTATLQTEAPQKRRFWAVYGRPLAFIGSMLLAPVVFVLLYWVFDWVIWSKWVNVINDIKDALQLTDSIKFTGYTSPLPSRPWEWLLSPTGSFNFYGWIFNQAKYDSIVLPYWYTPSYTGMINPTLWLSGLAVIPYAVWQWFKKNNAAIFVVCWIIGTWVVWIPLCIISDRVSFTFYYLPTIGAICLGTSLILTYLLDKAEARRKGKLKLFLELAIASFILLHLLAFCILSPLHLWISIPAGVLLLLFALDFLDLGWRFMWQFVVSTALATPLMCFVFYWPLKDWLVTGNAPWGLPEVSLLWVVSALIGLAVTWGLFVVIHLFVNKVIRDNTPAPQESGLVS